MRAKPILATLTALASLALIGIIFDLPAPTVSLPAQVHERLGDAGVAHPVTAVLLAFRAYDTLLEVMVLLAAVLCAVACTAAHPPVNRAEAASRPQTALVRVLVPVAVLLSGYVLWAGSTQPGGAFQAAAVLAAAGVMLRLSEITPPPRWALRRWRIFIVVGPAFFVLAGVSGMLAARHWLQWPLDHAHGYIVSIEVLLTVSIAATLFVLYGLGQGAAGASDCAVTLDQPS